MKIYLLPLLFLFILSVINADAQNGTIDRIAFSATASPDNGFQTIVGMPYSQSIEDANGSLTVSAQYSTNNDIVTGVKNEEKLSLNVFPNPVKNELNIQVVKPFNGQLFLQLTDALGKIVMNKNTNENNTVLDVQFLAQGNYILNITEPKTNQSFTYKIIKN